MVCGEEKRKDHGWNKLFILGTPLAKVNNENKLPEHVIGNAKGKAKVQFASQRKLPKPNYLVLQIYFRTQLNTLLVSSVCKIDSSIN